MKNFAFQLIFEIGEFIASEQRHYQRELSHKNIGKWKDCLYATECLKEF